MGVSRIATPSLLSVVLLTAATASADLAETFTTAATTGDGTTLGVCDQLTVRVFGGGSIDVPGTGNATVGTPVETDAALLCSTTPLPPSYSVTAEVGSINYPEYALENGVTLLAIANTQPLTSSSAWWSSYRMLAVEVAVVPGATNKHPVFVSYFDAANFYTWNGSSWGVGDPNWLPVITYDPSKSYQVTIAKAGGTYTITITSGGVQLTQATVPVANVLPATSEYFVIGDRLTNYFKGSMQIHAVTQPAPPGCVLDAGVPDAAQPDAGVPDLTLPDAPSPDVLPFTPDAPLLDSLPPADAPAPAKDSAQTDKALPAKDSAAPDGTGGSSWDLFTPDLGEETAPDDGGSCGCRVGVPPHRPAGGLLLLALLLLLLRR